MAKPVHLNGGPYDGKTAMIHDAATVYKITSIDTDRVRNEMATASDNDAVPVLEGVYSERYTTSREFDWCGWDTKPVAVERTSQELTEIAIDKRLEACVDRATTSGMELELRRIRNQFREYVALYGKAGL